jgi:hypothetical protein
MRRTRLYPLNPGVTSVGGPNTLGGSVTGTDGSITREPRFPRPLDLVSMTEIRSGGREHKRVGHGRLTGGLEAGHDADARGPHTVAR